MHATRKHYRPQLETLEGRQLMAADITASFADGILAIEGTEGADSIVVRNNYGVVTVDGTNLAVWASQVKGVAISGLGGDDRIWVSGGNYPVSVPALVDAGAGNDLVVGGLGFNLIAGGEGNDVLLGSSGVDAIFGGGGDDMLYGLAGDDLLFGQDGADTINAGDGHDVIFGNEGNDRLFGGNGLDILHGGGGADELYGQAGDDYLFYDAADIELFLSRYLSGQAATIDAGMGQNRLHYNGGDAEMMTAIQAQNVQRSADLVASSFKASELTLASNSSSGLTGFAGIKKLMWDDQLYSGLSPYADSDYVGGFRADSGYAMGY